MTHQKMGRAASRFRLRTRSDVQSAVAWSEGKAAIQADEEQSDMGETFSIVSAGGAPSPSPCANRMLLRPAGLFGSLLLSALCTLSLERVLVAKHFGDARAFVACFAALYAVTLSCAAQVATCDPGQLDENSFMDVKLGVADLPERSHKYFQYPLPLRRFDHYCRWVDNGIALQNHREFMVMVAGIVTLAGVGAIVDIVLLMKEVHGNFTDLHLLAVVVHCMYCVGLAYYALPIFRLHVGFVSRNELANDWKNDTFYVAEAAITGEPVWVGDLNGDEYDAKFDSFRYDAARNHFDHGWQDNCNSFWCTARWAENQLGEF